MLLFLLATATGCSDWGEEPELNFLELESSNVSFDAYGGAGEIVVKTTAGVTVSSAATWCVAAVSGNKVAVTVPANGGLLGRSTVVTLISAGKKVQVPVTQAGLELKVESKTVALPYTAKDTTLQINCPIPVTAQSSATWLTAAVTVDNTALELQAEANGALASRTATVTLSAGDLTTTVTVTQKASILSYNSYIGTWAMTHTIAAAAAGTKYSKAVTVAQDVENESLRIIIKAGNAASSTFTIYADYDPATGAINLPAQILFLNGANYVINASFNGNNLWIGGGLNGTPTGGTVANPVLTFTDDGSADTDPSLPPIVGFILWRVNSSLASVGEYTGFGASSTSRYTNITMTKQ